MLISVTKMSRYEYNPCWADILSVAIMNSW